MINENEKLDSKVKFLPEKPGVYLFRNKNKKIIYVGKAKILKNRVSSYFIKSSEDNKVLEIQKQATDIEIIVTSSETEALILESSLIKLYKPKLNIRLRDDKTYPYLHITTDEKYPRAIIVRTKEKEKGLYFGPYVDIKALKITLRQALTIFPLATCRKDIANEKFDRPCLFYQLKRCTAPCVEKVTEQEYKTNLTKFLKFFEGKYSELVQELENEMEKQSSILNFEKAALIRDKLKAIEKIMQKQAVYSNDQNTEYDVFGVIKDEKIAIVQFLAMREGRIINQKHFLIDLPFKTDESEILNSFLKIYYSSNDYIPAKILVSSILTEQEIIDIWLSEKQGFGQKSLIITDFSEDEKNLLDLANENAKTKLDSILLAEKMKSQKIEIGLQDLKEKLKLIDVPEIIEGYDISTIQGSNTVASRVLFENGIPKKDSYRKFIINSIEKQDDYSSMKEVIKRRFTGSLAKVDPIPNLVLIDGGLGQVNVAKNELIKINLDIPIIGLAKEFEEIYFPFNNTPLKLGETSEGLKILQRVRDEAHRFAVSFHRKKRSKAMLQSSLEKIPGISEKRLAILLDYFGTFEKIKHASIEELSKVKGIDTKIAENIYTFYRSKILN
ncbi:MAG: excinuclease ABC subunit UvrC [Candidatus Thorarchaeota archaeon]